MSVNKKLFRLLFAAGGTGGHIFPAVAVAEKLKELTNGDIEIHWVGSPNRMEADIIPKLGYTFHKITLSGFTRILSKDSLMLPFRIYSDVRHCREIIRDNNIDAVVATGAYLSYPPGAAARKEGKLLFLMESNVNPGKAIKMLTRHADAIFTTFDESAKYYNEKYRDKIIATGNPVRATILNMPSPEEALKIFKLNKDKPTLLVFGGSLGAMTINNAIKSSIEKLSQMGINIIWQTGKNFSMRSFPENIRCFEFIENMGAAYSASDLVVSRSGATTIAELCITGKPSILVPLPSASNNEQYHNAKVLTGNGASIIVENEKLSNELSNVISSLIFDPDRLSAMGQSAKMLAKPDAAVVIAEFVLDSLGRRISGENKISKQIESGRDDVSDTIQ